MQLGQLRRGRGERQPQLLEPPRHPHRPALVAEVPLDLADDRRGGVRGELHPRSGSKRSTDLIRPMVATWVRSSSGSPRLRKRRARCSTSGRCIRTRRLRSSAYSGVPSSRVRSSRKRARAPLRSCGGGGARACPAHPVCSVRRRQAPPAPRPLARARSSSRPSPFPERSPRPPPPARPARGHPPGAAGPAADGSRTAPPACPPPGRTSPRSRPPDAAGPARDAVDAVRRALGRKLPCAAFFVPHRPVLAPHAGPGPAPRCL